jgi:hypothetical protein
MAFVGLFVALAGLRAHSAMIATTGLAVYATCAATAMTVFIKAAKNRKREA